MQKILGLILIVLGVLGVEQGFALEASERARSLFDAIGPDRYIVGLGATLALLGLALFLERRPQMVKSQETGEGGIPVYLRVFAVVVVYCLALPWLGYTVATLLFFLAAFRVTGVTSLPRVAAYSALATAGAYLLFVKAADMPLPRGVFDFLPA